MNISTEESIEEMFPQPAVQIIHHNKDHISNEEICIRDNNKNSTNGEIETVSINNDVVNNDVVNNAESIEETATDLPRRSQRVAERNKKIFNSKFVVYQSVISDPITLKEALENEENENWKKAIDEEMKAHEINKTWILCDVPKDRKAIKSKWLFITKLTAEGTIDRYKARLVVKGFIQKEGIDYDKTYAPVVRHSSIRLLIALAAKNDWNIDQMDVVTVFLHLKLDDEIYMELPDKRTCPLKKSINGLKQASRVWYKELDKTIKRINFKQSKFDLCIYRVRRLDLRYLKF